MLVAVVVTMAVTVVDTLVQMLVQMVVQAVVQMVVPTVVQTVVGAVADLVIVSCKRMRGSRRYPFSGYDGAREPCVLSGRLLSVSATACSTSTSML